ncbi:MAG: Phosphoserine phosphatase, HAD family, SerB [Candidatus Nomurabacteria bacterium GW2011_GWA1_46_11]|uniref:phosphoserine phosphatase n=2 Tax=Parcubacteria group TaxID=1794811 RepID=A0A1G1YW83_9BACT|nr:MAG: Phosphoserine phosphatase, HAD family, SerB [Parcubacteria group bacterium GW2011_GWA2_46_10]KKU22217.1 MAG: Phosphoserine phosphatase, HAD family, SerB [Candidatus Nomurabacteria bacterium GW2011_GWA1_46_11]OGY56489.1 MAG: hypothetical protein A2119_00135 [Candidatus Colwellbacteria bacterium GWA2_46_10]
MFKAVIFDIDGTLTKKSTFWKELTEKLGGSVDKHMQLFEELLEGKISIDKACEGLVEVWNSTGRAVKPEFEKIFDAIPLRDDARDVVGYLKSKNYKLCIITGSLDIFAELIAKKVGINTWYANGNMKWDKDGKLINFSFNPEQAEQKVTQFKDYLKKNKLESNECVVVGDSGNDIGLFKLTGNGVVVRTEFWEDEFGEIAWRVIGGLSELKKIL